MLEAEGESNTPAENELPEVTQPAPDAEEQKPEEVTDETLEQVEAKKQSKFRRRLDNANKRVIEAQTESRLLREENTELKARKAPVADDAPNRDQFDDYESFLEARSEYRAEKKANEVIDLRLKEYQGQQQQTKQVDTERELAEAWVEREKAFTKSNSDFMDVVNPFVDEDLGSLQDGARQLIVTSEVGPQLLYHLASHPDLMDRIAELSSVRQIAELGKLEEKLSAPQRKPSNAPAPANHVNTGKTGSKDPEKMNESEFNAWRKANGSRYA